MPGRIEVYVHSDSVTDNKGACMVEVNCETDFAARTEDFIKFAKLIAQLAYGYNAQDWEDLVNQYAPIARIREEVEEKLGEKVNFTRVQRMTVSRGGSVTKDKHGRTVVRDETGKIIGMQG